MLYKQDWEKTKKRFEQWWANENTDRPVIQIWAPKKGPHVKTDYKDLTLINNLDKIEWVIDEFEKSCQNVFFGGEAIPVFFPNLGPGIVSAYLGAKPDVRNDTVWFETPKTWDEIRKTGFDPENNWWKKTIEATRISAEKGKDKWVTGITDLGGNLDVAASLRKTEDFLMDMVDSPEEVEAFCRKINKVLLKTFDELFDITQKYAPGISSCMEKWHPGRWYPLQCDFSAMISPKMFERFVLPMLQEQARSLDRCIYHMDGPNQIPHLDMLLEVPEITGIQWLPGAGCPSSGSPKWVDMCRKIQAKGKLLVMDCVPFKDFESIISNYSPKGLLIAGRAGTEEEARAFLAKYER